ncbi:MAG: 1-acyl-sn-glycerol-3-phosphate acyltransferase [Anaerolineales bacterium]|nr:1-acyl-sn-glycerol-3-phosphate acyltransferase [Anaerolineales bacterium]MCX7609226.1 1-acyl-sn-glycerol-3-phosphate acyltransferase [Anaerolineales bacterium]MDW8226171.1 lysophospholipid acyltransferase family protein [Anaerolineales bacterium]
MQTIPSSPSEKPVSLWWRPDLVRLPALSWQRRAFRGFIRLLCRCLMRICAEFQVSGLEHYPCQGPALLVINHLGDADAVAVLAALPEFPEAIAKIELRSIALLRWVMDGVGVIYVHRGRPDRRALAVALQALREGRKVILAPEGRQSLTGALEQGTEGAAFLALKAGVPIIPIALTGTENWRVYGNLKRLRRTHITVTVGVPFCLPDLGRGSQALKIGTQYIMEALARLLPYEYRGEYAYVS